MVSFSYRVVSPDTDMVYPMKFINDRSPVGVHHNHKYWELEMVLDTNYLEDNTAPLEYWAYYLDVQGAGETAIACDGENDWIEWFKVYIREGDGTQTLLEFADEDESVLWCVGEVTNINNENDTRHQTTTWKFICLQEVAKSYTAVVHNPVAAEEPIKIMRIDNFTIVGEGSCTNVLRFEDEFIMEITPQFLPNTFQGVDVKQDQKWRKLTIVVDSVSDIFDPYVDITTANTIIPANFYVEFTLADGAATTERWTYSGGAPQTSYILNRLEGVVDGDSERDTVEYQIITTCDRAITQP